jgi:uroporphyrinogen decarboxylase
MMTARERLLAALAHREPDRVPLDFRCGEPALRAMIEESVADPGVKDRFLHGDVDFHSCGGPLNNPVFARYHRRTPPQATIDDWGRAALRHPDSGEDLLTAQFYYPLAGMSKPAELDDYPWPDMDDPARWDGFEQAVRASHAAGRAAVGQMSQSVVELCYGLRSMEQLFVDLGENPAFVERLFTRITELRCTQARRMATAGVDVLRIGDDLATQQSMLVSPATYRRWIRPCHAAIVQAARRLRPDLPVLYHSDGNVEQLIPELLEIGVTAVNPVQPECVDPDMVKDRWGDRLTIWGAVSTQRTLAFGSEKDVEAECQARMDHLAPGGGYVVNFINTVWSARARRNVLCYLWAVQERGVYG